MTTCKHALRYAAVLLVGLVLLRFLYNDNCLSLMENMLHNTGRNTKNSNNDEECNIICTTVQHTDSSLDDRRPLVVLGVLTVDGNADNREAQRKTWLSRIRLMDNRLPFRIVYKFWFDMPSNESMNEDKVYGDVEYLNVYSHGRAVKFGEKLYIWLRHIHTQFPEALLGIRVDDDVFLCVPQLFEKLDKIKSATLYYGWGWNSGDKVTANRFVDEMFVVLGRGLIDRIAHREYCDSKTNPCNKSRQLVEMEFGSPALGIWLSVYDDVDFKPDNKHLVHHNRAFKGNRSAIITPDYCNIYLNHHKSNPQFMETLHRFNSK